MSEWLAEYGMFLAKAVTLIAVLVLVVAILSRAKSSGSERTRLRVERMNERNRQRQRRLQLAAMDSGLRKAQMKAFKRSDKQERKTTKVQGESTPAVWVLDFQGDLKATATTRLGEEISAVLGVAKAGDEVVLRLESAGGLVHAYGLAAAQLDRLRSAGLKTTACIDKVAASGGYMMACCADRIHVAPFAVLGSIGVVAQLPNLHRLLKRHDIDVELLTAGRYKRTLTVFGENTQEGREKFAEDLENTHALFKRHVAERRPVLDVEAVATGEIWYGREAIDNQLADTLGTSEQYLQDRMLEAKVVSVSIETRRSMGERMGLGLSNVLERGLQRVLEVADASRWLRR
ncbi:protease SohB [Litchfieldella xinjiangensis]|uniref:protease SohB n=1 Tax=Litchfieldella xinjiangensis TaxID=1166948 RepID=UPI0005BB5097|nr:protease SohB [Halomonas xinjiangensis]